jgi:hypothetical protein
MIFVYICSTLIIVEVKTRFETWIILNGVNVVSLFHHSFSITLMVYLRSLDTECPNQVLYVLLVDHYTTWAKQGMETWLSPNNYIRICLLGMSRIWTKNAIWDVNNRNCKWWNIVSSFLSNNTYALPVLTMGTKNPKYIFYVWLVDLHSICAKQGLETWFSPNNDIRLYLLHVKHSRTKNAFWNVNNTKWRKWRKFVSPFLFNNTYGFLALTTDTKLPNPVLVQIKYFMCD